MDEWTFKGRFWGRLWWTRQGTGVGVHSCPVVNWSQPWRTSAEETA